MKFSLKDNYQWKNPELQKRAKLFNWFTLVAGAITLIIYFSRNQDIIMLNLVFLILAGIFWYVSYDAKQKDKKIK